MSNSRLRTILVATVLAVVAWRDVESAAAKDVACLPRSGALRARDVERGTCGYVTQDTPDWRRLSPLLWDNRMDEFVNDDRLRGRTMCLYDGYFYRGVARRVRPGQTLRWPNAVSSSRWSCTSPLEAAE